LGHTIGQGKLLSGTDKIEAVKKASKPETKKQVKILLGLANFYWKCVPSFASTKLSTFCRPFNTFLIIREKPAPLFTMPKDITFN
jgi:hypothetical protein